MTPRELKKARMKMGLTQQELAEETGVKRLTIVRYETGVRPISETFAILISYMLKA